MRFFALAIFLLSASLAFSCEPTSPTRPSAASVQGIVADPTGAIVPGAEIDLIDTNGSVAGSAHSGGDGNFQVVAPHAGSFMLVISEAGFETVHAPVTIAPTVVSAANAVTAHTFVAPLHITLPIAAVATNVRVNADTNEDLTAPEENHDSSVLTSQDLKALPIFDNDYATAMSAFLDDSASSTGGSGLMVDGVEANRTDDDQLHGKRTRHGKLLGV